MNTLPMKGRGSALAMVPEGPKIIAHGFSRGKGVHGTREALEGRYKRTSANCRFPSESGIGATRHARLGCRGPALGLYRPFQGSWRSRRCPTAEAVGCDLSAPSGRKIEIGPESGSLSRTSGSTAGRRASSQNTRSRKCRNSRGNNRSCPYTGLPEFSHRLSTKPADD